MSDKPFGSLPAPVKAMLREQLQSTVELHKATGLPMVECRRMVLRAGGRRELLELIGLLHLKGEM